MVEGAQTRNSRTAASTHMCPLVMAPLGDGGDLPHVVDASREVEGLTPCGAGGSILHAAGYLPTFVRMTDFDVEIVSLELRDRPEDTGFIDSVEIDFVDPDGLETRLSWMLFSTDGTGEPIGPGVFEPAVHKTIAANGEYALELNGHTGCPYARHPAMFRVWELDVREDGTVTFLADFHATCQIEYDLDGCVFYDGPFTYYEGP